MSALIKYRSVKPFNYNLRIFNIEFGGEWTFEGRVAIDAEATTPVDRIIINAYQIDISCSEVSFDLNGSSSTFIKRVLKPRHGNNH